MRDENLIDVEDAAPPIFKALGNPKRLQLLLHIQANQSARVKDLLQAVGGAQSTLSQHLDILVGAGLLARSAAGFVLVPDALSPALDVLLILDEPVAAPVASAS